MIKISSEALKLGSSKIVGNLENFINEVKDTNSAIFDMTVGSVMASDMMSDSFGLTLEQKDVFAKLTVGNLAGLYYSIEEQFRLNSESKTSS